MKKDEQMKSDRFHLIVKGKKTMLTAVIAKRNNLKIVFNSVIDGRVYILLEINFENIITVASNKKKNRKSVLEV